MFDEWYVVVTSTYHQHVDMLIGDKEPTCSDGMRFGSMRIFQLATFDYQSGFIH